MYIFKYLFLNNYLSNYILFVLSIIIFNQNINAQYKDVNIDYFGQTPPGKKAVIFSPDFICKPGEFIQNCCFSQDGTEFIYVITDTNWSYSIIMYTKYLNGKWSTPVPLPCSGKSGGIPCFSYDGNDLYLIMRTPSADIYVCHRTADGWSEPIKLAEPMNTSWNEGEISISQNNTLYFSSQRSGGYGDHDLYSAVLVDGSFTNITNLGVPINTSSKDECPSISPDESFMVFNDWKNNPRFAGNNLYITYRKKDGSWTNPKDLGPNINTNQLDIYPYITPDGKYLMFTRRDRSSSASSSKLYWTSTEFIDSLRHTNFEPYCKNNIPNMSATVGTLFTYQIPDSIFYDDDEKDTLSYTVINMPSWMSFDNKTRTLSGTPTAKANPKWMTITVTDLAGGNISTRFSITAQNPTDVKNYNSSIGEFMLDQNYPNPFNPVTTISYQLRYNSHVELNVYDMLGRKVKTLVNKEQIAGTYQVDFDGNMLSSGVYIYTLKADDFISTKEMILLK